MTRPTSSAATTEQHRDLRRVEVDLDLRHGRRPAERRVGVAGVRVVVEVAARVGDELLVDAGRAVVAGVVPVREPERAPGPALDLRLEPARGVDEEPADDHRGPRGDRRPGVRHERRVLRRHLDVVDVELQLRGDQLREDRLRPLAHLGRRGEDPDPAVGGQLEARDRAHLLLARAREPGAVPREREADPAGGAGAGGAGAARGGGLRARPLEPRRLGRPLEHLGARHVDAEDLLRRRHAARPGRRSGAGCRAATCRARRPRG